MHKILTLIPLLLLSCIYTVSETYAKATKVNDIQEFNKIAASLQAGDTLVLANKTWSGVKLVLADKQGTDAEPIVVTAETFGKVIIAGNSNLNFSGQYVTVEGLIFLNAISAQGNLVEFRTSSSDFAQFSRLTRCVFIDCNPPVSTKSYCWVAMYGAHNRMDHCYFRGKTNGGPTFSLIRPNPDPNYAQIDSNYFAFRPPLHRNGGESLQIGTSEYSLYSSSSVVEYNLFEQCNGEIETISNKSCDNIYRYNTFLNNGATLTLRHGNRCTVDGNFFIGNNVKASGGVRVIGEGHKIMNNYFSGLSGTGSRSALSIMDGFNITDTTDKKQLSSHLPVRRVLILNNTFVDNIANIEIGSGKNEELTIAPDHIAFANNVIVAKKGGKLPLVMLIDSITHPIWKHNFFTVPNLAFRQCPEISLRIRIQC